MTRQALLIAAVPFHATRIYITRVTDFPSGLYCTFNHRLPRSQYRQTVTKRHETNTVQLSHITTVTHSPDTNRSPVPRQPTHTLHTTPSCTPPLTPAPLRTPPAATGRNPSGSGRARRAYPPAPHAASALPPHSAGRRCMGPEQACASGVKSWVPTGPLPQDRRPPH